MEDGWKEDACGTMEQVDQALQHMQMKAAE